MNETEKELRQETEKWLKKIECKMPKVKETPENKPFIKNIKAYISDCKHFLKEGKLILSFEAIIWAWAWLEILQELKKI